jgi:hypothetical protein
VGWPGGVGYIRRRPGGVKRAVTGRPLMQVGSRAARQATLPAQARPALSGRAGPACYSFVPGRAWAGPKQAGPRAARSARPIWPSIDKREM